MNTEFLQKTFQTGLVRDLATESFHARNVLERLGIDSCCGSGLPLKEAAQKAGVTYETLEKQLLETDTETGLSGNSPETFHPDWRRASNGLLASYIMELHHTILREDLPFLKLLFNRVLKAHADHAAELEPLAGTFLKLMKELLFHLDHEENVLLTPLLHQKTPDLNEEELMRLQEEHSTAGELLHQMRAQTNGYRVPDFACEAVKSLYNGLKSLDLALHEHIWIENNVLLPGFQTRHTETQH